jgi:hypothetical protein
MQCSILGGKRLVAGTCTLGFQKIWEFSALAERMFSSQGLCSFELGQHFRLRHGNIRQQKINEHFSNVMLREVSVYLLQYY